MPDHTAWGADVTSQPDVPMQCDCGGGLPEAPVVLSEQVSLAGDKGFLSRCIVILATYPTAIPPLGDRL